MYMNIVELLTMLLMWTAISGYAKSKGDILIIAGATDAGAIFVSKKDLIIKSSPGSLQY